MWIIADVITNAMALAGVVLLSMFLFRRFHRQFLGRGTSSSSEQSATQDGKQFARHVMPPVDYMQWQVEMHELATSMKGELDSKMRLLQMLIGQARTEADRLERLLGAEVDASARPAATATATTPTLEELPPPDSSLHG
jgi:hypothetical protein